MNILECVQKIVRYLKREVPEIKSEEKEELVKNFDLAVILSYTCGTLVTPGDTYIEKIVNQLPLAWFVDDMLECDGYIPPKDEHQTIKQHILGLHPELANVKYDPNTGLTTEEFVEQQKTIFGNELPICPLGCTLESASQMLR